jgi:phage recombination protein Bet
MASDIVKYEDSVTHKEIVLGLDDVRKAICPTATEQEATNFLRLCQYMGLNPFVRDAYLIKYGDGPASMVVGKDAFTKRADAHPQFAGMQSGAIIVQGDSEPIHRKGSLVLDGERLVGGWAKVARTDRKLDTETSVSFSEFDTGRAMWKKMPAIMIEKCAIVKALRTAFPSTFSGMYDSAEMGIDMTEDFEPDNMTPPAIALDDKPKRPRVKALKDDAEVSEVPEATSVEPDQESEESSATIVEAAQELGAVIVETLEGDEELVSSEGTPHCAEHGIDFEWKINPDTDEGKYVHPYTYDRDGKTRKGWCVAQETA